MPVISLYLVGMQKIIPHISWLKNKYLISILLFGVWMLFLDKNNLLSQKERLAELHKVQNGVHHYEDAITQTKKDLGDLQNNPATLEKYAREHFYMKKDNEDLYLISDPVPVAEAK